MPIYEYRCRNGHSFEVIQRMSDDPVETCEVCGEAVERVFHPVAVHFKGSGFYTTDYKDKAKTGASAGNGGETGSSDGGSDSKGDSGSKPDSGSKAGSAAKGDSGSSGGDSKGD